MNERKRAIDDVQNNYGFSDGEMESIISICELMPGDPDGCWSMLNDYSIDIEFEDVATICEFFV